ncbi:MAG: bifunctional phosphoribosyl-AMP cyclohydrolase/phosphoribosyl-ATP diphosphatase HisIE [Gemmatimonadaceae bacterium]
MIDDVSLIDIDSIDFAKGNGLVTVVAQDATTGAVLMVAHADREALEKTAETGEMHYRSRTRGLWHKGATSGNTQRVVSLTADCDRDSVLARVTPAGPACHTLDQSCFGSIALSADSLGVLSATIESRAQETAGNAGNAANSGNAADRSYTRKLLEDRNLRLKKIGEEAAELVTACADGDRERAGEEGADLLYHMLVALRAQGITLDDVRRVLAKRAG